MCLRLMAPKKKMLLKIKSNVGQITSPQDCASDEKNGNDRDKNAKASCEVYKEYSVIGELDIRKNKLNQLQWKLVGNRPVQSNFKNIS